MAKSSAKEKVLTAWLSNEGVIYGILGIVVLIILYFGIGWLKVAFSKLVDWVQGLVQSVVPRPKTQDSNQRTFYDPITGLAYSDDRALSDLGDFLNLNISNTDAVDNYTGYLPTDVASRVELYQSNGWIDKNGNLTDAGKVAASQGLMKEPGT